MNARVTTPKRKPTTRITPPPPARKQPKRSPHLEELIQRHNAHRPGPPTPAAADVQRLAMATLLSQIAQCMRAGERRPFVFRQPSAFQGDYDTTTAEQSFARLLHKGEDVELAAEVVGVDRATMLAALLDLATGAQVDWTAPRKAVA